MILSAGEHAASVNKEEYDLLIIGSAELLFQQLSKQSGMEAKVGMIERGTVGGTCVNTGCVPSKTLLELEKSIDPHTRILLKDYTLLREK